MSLLTIVLLAGTSAIAGAIFGYILRWLIFLGKKGSVELKIQETLLEAKEKAQKIIEEADKKTKELTKEAENKISEKEDQLKKLEDRLLKKDELLDKRRIDIDSELEHIKERVEEIKKIKEEAEAARKEEVVKLERVSGLSKEEAKNELVSRVEKEYEKDLLSRMQKLEQDAEGRLDRKAKDILTSIIQRLAVSCTNETMSTALDLPSDDIKGKIIGKEGRNIRAFERATGVELIVDDTPGTITISAFDPVRRAIARVALERLIADGRIHPAKIEESVEQAKEDIGKIIKEKGEQAAYESGVFNLDPRIIAILGRLHFRTSYGQNVLQHSVEMAHLAGMLAEELGGDPHVARAGALLHDIGKAVDHEIQGTHVEIGKRILQKFGADEHIIKAMQAHHEEYPYETIESIIVQTADSLSGGRPGARRDSIENYLKRLGDLEGIANSFPGVEKSFAISAGREIRVFVTPNQVSDIEAKNLARNIASRIEQELKYPGEIKIIVIREARAIEYAR
jgi:ribonuclease Y